MGYTPTKTWKYGDKVTPEDLNHIELGLKDTSEKADEKELPSAGIAGQILSKTQTGVAWIDTAPVIVITLDKIEGIEEAIETGDLRKLKFNPSAEDRALLENLSLLNIKIDISALNELIREITGVSLDYSYAWAKRNGIIISPEPERYTAEVYEFDINWVSVSWDHLVTKKDFGAHTCLYFNDCSAQLLPYKKKAIFRTFGTYEKQDVITDLAEIRTGAAKGAIALQKTDILNSVESTAIDKALSANMGKELNTRIDNLLARGRYLSTWDATTGKPKTEPTVLPYTYKTGDYFIVAVIGETNYKPTGKTYTGAASTVIEEGRISVNDTYYFDGTTWALLHVEGRQLIPEIIITADKIADQLETPAALDFSNFPDDISIIENESYTTIKIDLTDPSIAEFKTLLKIGQDYLFARRIGNQKLIYETSPESNAEVYQFDILNWVGFAWDQYLTPLNFGNNTGLYFKSGGGINSKWVHKIAIRSYNSKFLEDRLNPEATIEDANKISKVNAEGNYELTSIKTINNQSILGSGNIEIQGVTDYNQLSNIPVINADLDAEDFIPEIGKYYRHTGINSGVSGTPFTVGDSISKVYFDTTKTLTEADFAAFNIEPDSYKILFADEDGPEGYNCAARNLAGGYMISVESGRLVYSTIAIEGLCVVGWQNLDTDGAYSYDSLVTIATINSISGWNGIWCSKTAITPGSQYVTNTIYKCTGIDPSVIYEKVLTGSDIATKQDKLGINPTTTTQTLTGLTIDGTAYAIAGGGGLPDASNASKGDSLKVKPISAKYKFTSPLVETEEAKPFYINLTSTPDLDSLELTEVFERRGINFKTLFEFSGSIMGYEDMPLALVVWDASDEVEIEGLRVLDVWAVMDYGEEREYWPFYTMLYVTKDFIVPEEGIDFGANTWIWDQPDSEWKEMLVSYYLSSLFTVDPTITGNSIYKTIKDTPISNVISEELFDLSAAFGATNEVEKLSDATFEYYWESGLPQAPDGNNLFYTSNFIAYNFDLDSTLEYASNDGNPFYFNKAVDLDLNKFGSEAESQFSDYYGNDLLVLASESVYKDTSTLTGIPGQGLALYRVEKNDSNDESSYDYFLLLNMLQRSSNDEKNVLEFEQKFYPIYSTAENTYTITHNYETVDGEAKAHDYVFEGAGWQADCPDSITSHLDFTRTVLTSTITNPYTYLIEDFGNCIGIGITRQTGVYYPGQKKANSFKDLETILDSVEVAPAKPYYSDSMNDFIDTKYSALVYGECMGSLYDYGVRMVQTAIIPEATNTDRGKILAVEKSLPESSAIKKYNWVNLATIDGKDLTSAASINTDPYLAGSGINYTYSQPVAFPEIGSYFNIPSRTVYFNGFLSTSEVTTILTALLASESSITLMNSVLQVNRSDDDKYILEAYSRSHGWVEVFSSETGWNESASDLSIERDTELGKVYKFEIGTRQSYIDGSTTPSLWNGVIISKDSFGKKTINSTAQVKIRRLD